MAILKLKRWPFEKDEKVELYWLCSPRLDHENRWYIKAVFLNSKHELKEVIYPWGTLPALRLGQKYKNGTYCDNEVKGSLGELKIPSFIKFETCIGFELPRSLYSFNKNPEYGNQFLCKFDISGRSYYIPCTEIVRSFLTPYKFLANLILKPSGIDTLIESYKGDGDILEFNLTEEYPRQLLQDATLGYLAWLKFDKAAAYSWNSVYSNILKKAAILYPSYPTNAFRKGIPIEVRPPMNGKSIWTYRGVSHGSSTLILELLFRSELNAPYSHVFCNHPSMERIETDDKPRGARVDKDGRDEQEVNLDDKGQPAKKQENQTMVEQPPMMFSFKNNLQIIRIHNKKRTVHTGEPDVVKTESGRDREIDALELISATTQDWEIDADIAPIEFRTLEMVKTDPNKALEKFLMVINLLKKKRPTLSIWFSVIYIPYGKSFSLHSNGYRRTCAIAKVTRPGFMPCYIIEVDRSDGWSISTLFVSPISSIVDNEFEGILDAILKSLVSNNGHWDNKFFKRQTDVMFGTLKHISGWTNTKWLEKITRKL